MSSLQTLSTMLSVLFSVGAQAATGPQHHLRKLQENPQVPIGFQSGPDPGATYGGSVVYRSDSSRIYVTGATYGNFFKSGEASSSNANAATRPSCFLGIADLPPADKAGSPMTWLHAQQWTTSVPEACNAIYVDQNPLNLPENNTRIKEKLYLLGYTSTSGLLEALRLQSTFPAEQYGMILDVDIVKKDDKSDEFSTTFWGGRLLQDGPVQYPIDLTLDDEGNIYIASLQTYDTSVTSKSTRLDQVAKQMVDPWMKPYGSEYNMLLEQFLYDNPGYDDGVGVPDDPKNVEIDTTIVDNWRQPYGPSNGSGSVLVAGIEFLGGLLIVVGSTNGHGEVFGNEVMTNQNHEDTSWDGFVTKIIPDSGSYYQFVVDNGAPASETAQVAHKRSATSFLSMNFKDDYIMGMCHSPADPKHIYLVGTTEGQMATEYDALVDGEVHAFLIKVDIFTLLPSWTKQIGGSPSTKDVVKGMACAVTSDGKDVYMAGVVENGGSFSLYEQKSFGKDDVFLFQASAEDGSLQFLRQIGTSGNDRLAPGGLTIDEFGNAILMGQTDGSFYRSRRYDQESEKSEDLFIMTVIRGTGDFKEPQVPDSAAGNTSAESASTEKPAETAAPSTNEQKPAAETQAPLKPVGHEPEIYTHSAELDKPHIFDAEAPAPAEQPERQRYGLTIYCILFVIIGLIAGLFAYRQMRNRREILTDRDAVLEYLNEFDVDDIDLKKSATGGYHCSYTNDLAHGINARAVSREGLFGPMGFSGKSGHEDPLLAVHPRDPRAGGEIHFCDEPADDVSSIGSGIATKGRHSTHNDALLADFDGDTGPPKDMAF